MTGADIVASARAWRGVKYRHQGRSREGVDCIGLAVCVRADLGLEAFDADPCYAATAEGDEMLAYCKANLVEVERIALRPGDIVVQMDGIIRHMAIVADYPPCPGEALGIIHAWLPNRRVVECRLDEVFMRTVRGCFRFPEVSP